MAQQFVLSGDALRQYQTLQLAQFPLTQLHHATLSACGLAPHGAYDGSTGPAGPTQFLRRLRSAEPAPLPMVSGNQLPIHEAGEIAALNARGVAIDFSPCGKFLAVASQEQTIRLFDVDAMIKNPDTDATPIPHPGSTANVGWSVLDVAWAPSSDYLVFSSWGSTLTLMMLAPTIETRVLDLGEETGEYDFGIFSVDVNPKGNTLIAGTNRNDLILADITCQKVLEWEECHSHDINAVTHLTPDIVCSGGDDAIIKVWDIRTGLKRHVGLFLGHTHGITSLDGRGDDRHLVSNSKDQSIKLFDMRKMNSDFNSPDRFFNVLRATFSCIPRWDYRSGPMSGSPPKASTRLDNSLLTMTGHVVHSTLIRAYFSPAATTGSRYVYSGSSDGCVYIFDVLTGTMKERVPLHSQVIRDVSWHPSRPLLATTSWDATVKLSHHIAPAKSTRPQRQRLDSRETSLPEFW